MPPVPSVILNSGVEMPILGFGVFQIADLEQCEQAVVDALEVGYRLIDTAASYGNEEAVGRAIKRSGVPRDEVFVTTKLWLADAGDGKTRSAFERSCERLQLDYLDLYLIHQPFGDVYGAWRDMEQLYRDGRVKAIGVSNFTEAHLDGLIGAVDVVPAVNQVEFSPFLYQRELLAACRRHGVQLEAYSPLTRGRRLSDARVTAIAREHGRSPAQVLIRWALQHELVVIPKSVHRARIAENRDVFDFELSEDEMAHLDALDEGLRVAWDPTDVR